MRARRFLRENWYRDVWLLIISVAVLVLAIKCGQLISDVKEGRRTAVGVSCAATSAVIDAGRSIITGQGGSGAQDPEFLKNLEKLGYPPKAQRDAASKKAADFYTQSIFRAIAKQVGAQKASQVVTPDGHLDCLRVRALSNAK